MHGEIITIGSELISGSILDLNAWYAAARLTASGLIVTRITTVGDDPESVSKTLKEAVGVSRFVIITGGLGSTEDDMTNEIVAKALGRPLCLHKEMFEKIESHAGTRGIEMSPYLEKMAWMPEGSRMLNPKGATCGFSLIENQVRLYFLPGVPDQMRYMMDKYVIPEILIQYKPLPVLRQKTLKVYGLSEPRIAQILNELSGQTGNVHLGVYPYFPEIHITISLRGQDEATVMGELDRMEEEIQNLMGPFIFSSGNQTLAEVVGKILREKGPRISVAESCTGGLIGNLLTNVPGSSQYFQGGAVVYSDESKMALLNVSSETIKRHGAVSDQTVREMAEGVKKRLNTDIGLAVTGIAGPDGGTEKKPVGTVHVGLAVENETFSGKFRFRGTREQVKLNTSMTALDWVRRYLNGYSFLPGI
jgi:nicotinamide-nucleotide amidase